MSVQVWLASHLFTEKPKSCVIRWFDQPLTVMFTTFTRTHFLFSQMFVFRKKLQGLSLPEMGMTVRTLVKSVHTRKEVADRQTALLTEQEISCKRIFERSNAVFFNLNGDVMTNVLARWNSQNKST